MAVAAVAMPRTVYTIGHSTHPIERFLQLLTGHHITAVADVRSQPASRFKPQFNREALRAALEGAGIAYAFLGAELGARSRDASCYRGGQVQFDRLAQTTKFQDGLDRIERGISRHRVALMCAEKDPLTCHRTILVARQLVDRGVEVAHILEDARLESHDAAMARLLHELRLDGADLFRDRRAVLVEAYARRGAAIAYVDPAAVGRGTD